MSGRKSGNRPPDPYLWAYAEYSIPFLRRGEYASDSAFDILDTSSKLRRAEEGGVPVGPRVLGPLTASSGNFIFKGFSWITVGVMSSKSSARSTFLPIRDFETAPGFLLMTSAALGIPTSALRGIVPTGPRGIGAFPTAPGFLTTAPGAPAFLAASACSAAFCKSRASLAAFDKIAPEPRPPVKAPPAAASAASSYVPSGSINSPAAYAASPRPTSYGVNDAASPPRLKASAIRRRVEGAMASARRRSRRPWVYRR